MIFLSIVQKQFAYSTLRNTICQAFPLLFFKKSIDRTRKTHILEVAHLPVVEGVSERVTLDVARSVLFFDKFDISLAIYQPYAYSQDSML